MQRGCSEVLLVQRENKSKGKEVPRRVRGRWRGSRGGGEGGGRRRGRRMKRGGEKALRGQRFPLPQH